MHLIMRKYLAAFVIVLAFAAGCTQRSAKDSAKAPDFTLQDLNGKSVKLSDFKGKVVVLEFWATWCPPCRDSITGLEKIHKAYKDKGLVILAVSLDQGGWDSVKAFVSDRGMTYIVLKGDEEVANQYQVRSIPMLLVLDKSGNIAKRYIGLGSDEELEQDIKSIL